MSAAILRTLTIRRRDSAILTRHPQDLPPPCPQLTRPLGVLASELVPAHDLDVGLRVDGGCADPHFSIPASVSLDSVNLDPVAAVLGKTIIAP